MSAPKLILCVDDSDFDRSLLRNVLLRKGDFRVEEATRGAACLEFVEREKPDLILMDILMPGSSGLQTLKSLRMQHNAMELPVIMVSAKDEDVDVVDCLQAGANDYITKPVNFEVALSRVSTHLRLGEVSREMGRLKELGAIDAMITTYNHEINNPLAIALGLIDRAGVDGETQDREKLRGALWRIADIVKRIKALSEQRAIEYDQYAGPSKILKVK